MHGFDSDFRMGKLVTADPWRKTDTGRRPAIARLDAARPEKKWSSMARIRPVPRVAVINLGQL